jgi:carboxypeptidase Taq
MTPAADPVAAYRRLEERFRRMAVLEEIGAVLHWDGATMMPPGGAGPRGDHLAEIRLLAHQALTDPDIAGLLDEAEAAAGALDPWQAANLRQMRRDHTMATALPPDLVGAMSRAASACEHAWRDARAASDFAAVAPKLEAVIRLTAESAAALGGALNLAPYDALLEQYAPGMRIATVDRLFADLTVFLRDLLPQVLARQAAEGPPPKAPGPVPQERQRRLVERLAAATGFDPDRGRIDTSAHPFSTGYPGDHRITVAYHESAPMSAVMATLHECGHAAYEAGLPEAWARQPVGRALGMVLHESQSLSVEMQASRSDAFLTWLADTARAELGEDPAYAPGNFIRFQQWVAPDFIRVEADEVTYPAHVILRTRLERPLLSGDLPVSDLPGAWNAGMEDLLGIEVPDDRRGCLQDIHWYDGAFGYFPTYTLGAMLAAQLAEAARAALPDLDAALGRGEFSGLMGWQADAIHAKGSLMDADGLIRAATGRSLDAEAFQRHLRRRYLKED